MTLYAIWAQDVHDISGNITSPQSGAVQVKLRQGNAVYAVIPTVTMSGDGSLSGSLQVVTSSAKSDIFAG